MDAKTLNTLIYTKEGPCVSVIVPMFRVSRDRMQNTEIIRKAKDKAEAIVNHQDISAEKKNAILSNLDAITKDIDVTHLSDGLGFFVSPELSQRVNFPFPVEERIIFNNTFETRDLLYLRQVLSPYYVLVLTKNDVRLFLASGDFMEEVKDKQFPLKHEDDYEYARPSLGSSYRSSLQSFEKDKGIISAIRLQSTYKQADKMLSEYVSGAVAGIILVGTKKLMFEFENSSTHNENIIGRVTGSYGDKNFSELPVLCWSAFIDHVNETGKLIIRELTDKSITEIVYGVRDVWKAAEEGKGLTLVVEKDYHRKAYKAENDHRIHLAPGKGYALIPDVVDDVIETVYRKKGNVVFVENNALENYDRIALILRYR